MIKYDPLDIVTVHFVIAREPEAPRVHAWTDDKKLLQFYLDFHECPMFKVKTITDTYRNITPLLNENFHDEITIGNLKTRDPEGKSHKGRPWIMIQVPITESEQMVVNDCCNDLMGSIINYADLNATIFYLEDKWFQCLEQIKLPQAVQRAIYQKSDKFWDQVELDQLLILYYNFSNLFGA